MEDNKLKSARIAYSKALHELIGAMLKSGMDTTEIWCELELTLASVERIADSIED